MEIRAGTVAPARPPAPGADGSNCAQKHGRQQVLVNGYGDKAGEADQEGWSWGIYYLSHRVLREDKVEFARARQEVREAATGRPVGTALQAMGTANTKALGWEQDLEELCG